jgi:hypothetical protein
MSFVDDLEVLQHCALHVTEHSDIYLINGKKITLTSSTCERYLKSHSSQKVCLAQAKLIKLHNLTAGVAGIKRVAGD